MNQVLRIIAAVMLIAISAYVSVTLPISEKGIPFTAQSLVVFILAGLLHPRNFLIVIISYLLVGVLGLPVFADGSAGWSKLVGASGGFLYGFLFSGLVISVFMNGLKEAKFSKVVFVMLVGTLVLFLFGLSHLAYKFGISKALEYGLYPFWKMALVKALLAGIVVFSLNNYVLTKIKA